ncbi:hypothetical protein HDU92_002516 [Lobulomyces angularis]|nr:hypothetical protein HDU92_002516 [Lobulomyces angularis]
MKYFLIIKIIIHAVISKVILSEVMKDWERNLESVEEIKFVGGVKIINEHSVSDSNYFIITNSTFVGCLDVASGQEIWNYKQEEILKVLKKINSVIVVKGKKNQKVESIKVLDGKILWSYTIPFDLEKYYTEEKVPKKNIKKITDVAFFEVRDYEDRLIRLDVILISGGVVLSRINGETGESLFETKNEAGIIFHTICVTQKIIYFLGTNSNMFLNDKPHAVIHGYDQEKLPKLTYKNSFVLSYNNNNFLLFGETLKSLGTPAEKFTLWKADLGAKGKEILIGSFAKDLLKPLGLFDMKFIGANKENLRISDCLDLNLIDVYNSENIYSNKFMLECLTDQVNNKKHWILTLAVNGLNENPEITAFSLPQLNNTLLEDSSEVFSFSDVTSDSNVGIRIYETTDYDLQIAMFNLDDGTEKLSKVFSINSLNFMQDERIYNALISFSKPELIYVILGTTKSRLISFKIIQEKKGHDEL